MSYYRRPENKLESLLRWRRNVFLQLSGGGYVLVSATRFMLAFHHFNGSFRHDPARTEHRAPIPGLFDGNGWNLALLNQLIQPEKTMSDNQQPYAALYCKPLRASIRKLTDNELKTFVALVTYADDQGVCFPGARTLAEDTGMSMTDVAEALHGLKNKGYLFYLRHNAVDPITRRIQPDVFGLTPAILHLNSVAGIQTYMHEFLLHDFPSNHAQPDSKNQNQNPESLTNANNHHHQPTPEARAGAQDLAPDGAGKDASEGVGAGAPGQAAPASPQAPDKPTPISQTPTNGEAVASGNAATQNPSPSSAPPPPDAGDLKAYTVPLAEIDQEAYANELHAYVAGLQLAKARQLVAVYGTGQCAAALQLLRNQPFKAVSNPVGWMINKLRQGALVPQDTMTPDERKWANAGRFNNV
jgi:hypothetical protein